MSFSLFTEEWFNDSDLAMSFLLSYEIFFKYNYNLSKLNLINSTSSSKRDIPDCVPKTSLWRPIRTMIKILGSLVTTMTRMLCGLRSPHTGESD